MTKPWLTGKVTNGYWTCDKHKEEAITWLFETKLQWSDEQIKQQLTVQVVKDCGLSGLLYTEYEGKVYGMVEFYTKGRIQPWEMKKTPKGTFDDIDMQKKALRWLFETKLQWTEEQIKHQLSAQTFRTHGLSSLFVQYENYFDLIELVYPGRFNPWEMAMGVPRRYWKKKEHGRKAIEWLCQKRQETVLDFLQTGTYKDLMANCLSGLYQEYGEFHLLARALYPEYQKHIDRPWITKRVPNGFWDEPSNQIEAVKWLIEEKLDWSDEDIKEHMCKKIFNDHGFSALLTRHDSYFDLIELTYPGRFHPWEIMKHVPKKYDNWTRLLHAS